MKNIVMFLAAAGLLAVSATTAPAAELDLTDFVANPSFELVEDWNVGGETFNKLVEIFDALENVADGDPALPLDGTLVSEGTGQPVGGRPKDWTFTQIGGADLSVDARWPNWWHGRSAGPTDGLQVAFFADRGEDRTGTLKQTVGSLTDLGIDSGFDTLSFKFDARWGNASGGEGAEEVDKIFSAFIERDDTGERLATFESNCGTLAEGRLIPTLAELGTPLPDATKTDPGEPVSVGPGNMGQFNVDLDLTGVPADVQLNIGFERVDEGTFYNGSYNSRVWFDNVTLLAISPPGLNWDGGIGNWADSNWNGGQALSASMDMIINADTEDSHVTVAADFIDDGGNGTGPAMSVFVGEEFASKLTVASGVTLEVNGDTTAGEFGKIAVESGAVLQTGSATIEIDGRLIAGVQGVDSGLVQSAGQLTIEDADAIQVDWLPGADATSMFGGEYTIAEYTGTALATTGTTANADANIGVGYIKSVAYDVDLGAGVLGVNVELQPQGLGDTDLDADVDGDDLATFGLSWAPSGTDKTWFDGDFDFDGDIDGDDLAALGLAWAPSGISFPAGDIEVTAVPEPGSIVMLLIGAAGLLIYRKRR